MTSDKYSIRNDALFGAPGKKLSALYHDAATANSIRFAYPAAGAETAINWRQRLDWPLHVASRWPQRRRP